MNAYWAEQSLGCATVAAAIPAASVKSVWPPFSTSDSWRLQNIDTTQIVYYLRMSRNSLLSCWRYRNLAPRAVHRTQRMLAFDCTGKFAPLTGGTQRALVGDCNIFCLCSHIVSCMNIVIADCEGFQLLSLVVFNAGGCSNNSRKPRFESSRLKIMGYQSAADYE